MDRALHRYRAEGVRGLKRALRWRLDKRVGPVRRALGYRLVGPLPPADPIPIKGVLDWLATREAFTVVQIGAYVGDTPNDPLYEFLRATLPGHHSRIALLVEPVREYFDALRDAYSDLPTVRFENVAIADEEGDRNFYRLGPGVDPTEHGHPEWLTQMGSLHPDRMINFWDHWGREPEREMKEFWHHNRIVEKVHCWTFDYLLERHKLDHVDLLQIDAEGYDYEILRTINLSRLRPRFINYEHVHLYDDEPVCRGMLTDAGYVLFDSSEDTLAVALEAMDQDPAHVAAGLRDG